MPTLRITEPALLIRISKFHRPNMSGVELYEVTRGVWKIGDARDSVEYALAVAGGVVQEVYAVSSWQPAGSAAYTTRQKKDVAVSGRWEFTGNVARSEVRSKYLGKSVAHYFKRGNVNPINYVNIL